MTQHQELTNLSPKADLNHLPTDHRPLIGVGVFLSLFLLWFAVNDILKSASVPRILMDFLILIVVVIGVILLRRRALQDQ